MRTLALAILIGEELRVDCQAHAPPDVDARPCCTAMTGAMCRIARTTFMNKGIPKTGVENIG
jgi:hypothetical protein